MRIYSVVNLKGGVGKTTTVVNLAAIMATSYGRRVVVIDCDPQANTTDFFGIDRGVPGAFDVLTGKKRSPQVVLHETGITDDTACGAGSVRVMPANMELIELDIARMAAADDGMIECLRDFCHDLYVDDLCDIVLIDCPPSFTAASCAAIMASDEVIIPVKPDGFVLRGVADLLDQIKGLRRVNPNVEVGGVLITMWHNSEAVYAAVDAIYDSGVPLYNTRIRRTDKVDEASIVRQTLEEWSPFSSAGRDYRDFAAELLGGAANE